MPPIKLDEAAVTQRLAEIPSWSTLEGKLHRKMEFVDFSQAFGFMTRVAMQAELLGHHPEWSNIWNKVVVNLTTHDCGGISELDFALAKHIDAIIDGTTI